MTSSAPSIISGLSVRVRIVVLAVIPVIGFLANGVAFIGGEAGVEDAFESVKHAGALADTSQDFKGSLAAMRIHARDFGTRPSRGTIEAFEAAHALALRSLAVIETAIDKAERKFLIPLSSHLTQVIGNFSDLTRNQRALGLTENDGTRFRMTTAAATVERIINEDMSWMQPSDSQRLLISLLTMRRYES